LLLAMRLPFAIGQTKEESGASSDVLVLKGDAATKIGDVRALAFSPDSKVLVSGHENKLVMIWDARSGRELMVLRDHTGPVAAVAFSADGTLLATAGKDKTILLWAWGPEDADPPRGKLLATLQGHAAPVLSLAFSPDGKTLASGGGFKEGGVKLWDVANR